jgi:hypothetical protein
MSNSQRTVDLSFFNSLYFHLTLYTLAIFWVSCHRVLHENSFLMHKQWITNDLKKLNFLCSRKFELNWKWIIAENPYFFYHLWTNFFTINLVCIPKIAFVKCPPKVVLIFYIFFQLQKNLMASIIDICMSLVNMKHMNSSYTGLQNQLGKQCQNRNENRIF